MAEYLWHLPNHLDARYADALPRKRGEEASVSRQHDYLDYLQQIARAAELTGWQGRPDDHDLWHALGPGDATATLVGSYAWVAERLQAYAAAGIQSFLLGGRATPGRSLPGRRRGVAAVAQADLRSMACNVLERRLAGRCRKRNPRRLRRAHRGRYRIAYRCRMAPPAAALAGEIVNSDLPCRWHRLAPAAEVQAAASSSFWPCSQRPVIFHCCSSTPGPNSLEPPNISASPWK